MDPKRREFRKGLPTRVVRAEVHTIVNDLYQLATNELARLKAKGGLTPQDIRSVEGLARAVREARQLEVLVEEEMGDELGRRSDAELDDLTREGSE